MFKDDRLKEVLQAIYHTPQKLQSDFARSNAHEVACLASLGFITTHEGPKQFGRKWRITGIGLDKLRSLRIL